MSDRVLSTNTPELRDDASGRLSLAAMAIKETELRSAGKPGLLSDLKLVQSPLKKESPAAAESSDWMEKAGAAALVLGGFLLARSACRGIGLWKGFERGGSAGLAALEKSEAAEAASFMKVGLKPGLALDSSKLELASLESRSISELLKRPIPRFDQIAAARASDLPLSEAALKQSQGYVETGLIKSRLEDGVRLPVVTDSRGFTAAGQAVESTEKFIVVDRANDPVLKAVIDDAKLRFAGRTSNPELAMDLRNYVSSVMNRYNLPGSSLEQIYEETLRRNSEKLIPLGLFVGRGSGPCLPRSALFKTLGDEIGLQTSMREGFVGITRHQPHVWTEVNFGSKFQIYDASHPPNAALRYLSTKH